MADSAQSNYYNSQAASLAAQVANQAAQLEFQRMRFQELELPQFREMTALQKEQLAFQRASEVWSQSFREASLTGSYNGMPTAEYLLSTAQLTGTINQPVALTAQQQARYEQLQQAAGEIEARLISLPRDQLEGAIGDSLTDQLQAARTELATFDKLQQGTPVQTLQAQAQQAALSGMYQGQMTPEYAQMVAGLTGQFGGQQTQAAQQQQFSQAMQLAGLTGVVPGGGAIPGIGGVGGVGGIGGTGGLPGGTLGGGGGAPTLQAQEMLRQFLLSQAGVTGTYGVPGQLSAQQQLRVQEIQARIAQQQAAGEQPGLADLNELQSYQDVLSGAANQQQTMQARELERQFGLAEGALTGMYQGQQTQAAREFAQRFGLDEAAVTGLYQGQQTEAARQFAQQFGLNQAGVTGYYDGQATLGREEMEAGQANQLLQLAASLRGPRNAFQMSQVIGGTPSGLTDMLNAMAGRYNLPTFQGGGAAPERATLQNFVQDVGAATQGQYPMPGAYQPQIGAWSGPTPATSAYQPQIGQWGATTPSYQTNPPGTQAPSAGWNYQPTGDGSTYVYPPGISAPPQAGQISSSAPLSATNLQQIGASTLAQQPYALPAPSQLNAENYNNLGGYRQDLLKAAYENQGWDIGAFEDVYKQSLPTSGGPTTGAIKGVV